MLLRLPSNLHYPITITRVEARVGDTVKLNDDLFLYSYVTKVKQGSRYDEEEEEVDKKFVAHFQSTLEGSIKGWRVWEGDVIDGSTEVCEVEEECAHTVQFSGMCTNCGKDMTEFEPGSGTPNADRARIQALHDSQHLTISRDEANKIDEEAKKRLLAARKLSLVVDLDQTIIHAAVDPTIAEWQKDKDNPNYDAVKDVRSFQLIDDGPGMRGCWYYIKLRPGLEEFLEHVSHIYELHIYTMGTRQYAQHIAEIVDPERKYFGDRILSRDESGSMVAKNLERLFPVDTKMVVIIDDRGDVWKWSANLIRVTPFDFFVGIGDINSSFLPKKEEIQATPQPAENGAEVGDVKANGEHNGNGAVAEDGTSALQNGASTLEQLVAMGGGDDPALREMQSKGQEEIIVSQLEDKPLLRMQQQQDERDEAEAEAAAVDTTETVTVSVNGDSQMTQHTESDSSSSSESEKSPTPAKVKPRHSILKNDDEELVHLEARLTAVHTAFFNEYDRKRASGKGGRVAALAGKKKPPLPSSAGSDGEAESAADLQLIPDIKRVMPAMKMRVLDGVTIVFSGVLPLGTDIQNADISTWAKTFGAKITDKVTKDVTHVIAARAGTAKVKQAMKRGVKVVSTPWLIESIQRWKKLDERRFFLEGAGKQRFLDKGGSSDLEHEVLDNKISVGVHDFLLSSEDETSSGFGDLDGDEIDDLDSEDGQPLRKKLKINVDAANAPRNRADGQGDGADEFVDDGSPITINQDEWDDMDAELKEFMGSEAESESDNDSVTSALSYREKRSRKRQRDDDDDKEPDNSSGGDPSSRPEKIPRKSAGSALKTVANMENIDNSRINMPADIESERIAAEQKQVEDRQRQDEAEEEDSDDELARELEREMEGSGDE